MDNDTNASVATLRAFICHASEDKVIARQIATDLHAAGIDTFFDEWEISAGQSLRQKIDQGIAACTHFLILLTNASLLKPWVNAEIDAAFIQKIQRSAILIPLRCGLEASRLPPLLAPLLSPEIRDYKTDIRRLIDDIQGLSRKPPVHRTVSSAMPAWGSAFHLSPLAASVATIFAIESKNGRPHDPPLDIVRIREGTGASNDDLVDAISELTDLGWVTPRRVIGALPFGYKTVTPTELLFFSIDRHVMGWDAQQDAIRVAAELANSENRGLQSQVISERLGWSPRRLNPAISYLVTHQLVLANQNMNPTFVSPSLFKNERTRRFVRDNT